MHWYGIVSESSVRNSSTSRFYQERGMKEVLLSKPVTVMEFRTFDNEKGELRTFEYFNYLSKIFQIKIFNYED